MIPDYYSVIDTVASLLAPNGIMGVVEFYVQSKVDVIFRNYTGGLIDRHVNFLGPSAPNALPRATQKAAPEVRSKACNAAVANLSSNLPLPAFFYQNHHWRICYDERLEKHTQFNDEYIYAFTWKDSRADARILKLRSDDVALATCSAGDNILLYIMQSPSRVHAVDLNPTQCHLLELKVASYVALPYEDFWKLFGEGRHSDFRRLLISKLSPHLSSRAFHYWLAKTHIFASRRGRGLYDTGGSKHAICVMRWIARIFGLRRFIKAILEAKTLKEQRGIWHSSTRPAFFSTLVNRLVLSQDNFLWAALGVPKNHLAMIEADHAAFCGDDQARVTRSYAVRNYIANTLDPVVQNTHIVADNPYYHVCLAGQFSRKCHPEYLSPRTHARLSRPGVFESLRTHTDEIDEVIARITPGTLTVAVVMDSMDWFDPDSNAATSQIRKLNRALKLGGRVVLRSSALTPWYIKDFEREGFTARSHGQRTPGACIDRVNMYASYWVLTKAGNIPPPTPDMEGRLGAEMDGLVI
ncbi:hypothetical protein SLS53_009465 [Cytospora paraplurivora]|uniref:Uncharacterized protein n=1 Tax=Cytospora paraplurivora TaxID=2898453 RepID=A0AAN9TWJ2_9PEZI